MDQRVLHIPSLRAARKKLEADTRSYYQQHMRGAGANLNSQEVQEEYAQIKLQVGWGGFTDSSCTWLHSGEDVGGKQAHMVPSRWGGGKRAAAHGCILVRMFRESCRTRSSPAQNSLLLVLTLGHAREF